MSARLSMLAAACAVAFVTLGVWVTHHPPTRIDAAAAAVRGTNIALATIFTETGYGVALTFIAFVTIAGAFALRVSPKLPLAILISQIVSQLIVNALKAVFARPRPQTWFYRHELGFSYPSGHATTAIVFYGAWLLVAWFSPLPIALRLAVVGVMAIWLLAIGWSRVALGAHYPTDVIGGFLFGIGWLCAAVAIARPYALRGFR